MQCFYQKINLFGKPAQLYPRFIIIGAIYCRVTAKPLNKLAYKIPGSVKPRKKTACFAIKRPGPDQWGVERLRRRRNFWFWVSVPIAPLYSLRSSVPVALLIPYAQYTNCVCVQIALPYEHIFVQSSSIDIEYCYRRGRSVSVLKYVWKSKIYYYWSIDYCRSMWLVTYFITALGILWKVIIIITYVHVHEFELERSIDHNEFSLPVWHLSAYLFRCNMGHFKRIIWKKKYKIYLFVLHVLDNYLLLFYTKKKKKTSD